MLARSSLTSLATPHTLGVAAGEISRSYTSFFSYDHVLEHVGADVQLWATATTLGFSVYEALATRPRAS